MTRVPRKCIRSVVGAVLLGLGAFLLRENLEIAGRLTHFAGEGPGLVTAMLMAATRGWQMYVSNHVQFLDDVLLLALAWCRPILLIVGGAFLSRGTFAEDCDSARDPGCGNVEPQFGDIQ
jgi:hypothetical protein